MRVGLLGGSFDPIHKGHLKLAGAAVRQLNLSMLYFVPARRSPFKSKHPNISDRDRLALIRLAIKGKSRFKVGVWELKKGGPSYSVNTVRSYKNAHPSADLFFVMGSDTAMGFGRWKNPRKVLRLATLVVGRRPGMSRWNRKSKWMRSAIVLKGTYPDISSTRLRRRISIRMLPPSVVRYIKKRNLYMLSSRRRPGPASPAGGSSVF